MRSVPLRLPSRRREGARDAACSLGGRVALLCLLSLLAGALHAQRVITELESNMDPSSLPGDTLEDGSKRKKDVPVDVKAFTIDPVFGNVHAAVVDTLRHQYQNNDHNEGLNGHYSSLSNMGSPRLSRVYMERPLEESEFIFTTPFSQFIVEQEDFKYFDTKSPYTNLSYNTAGSKTTGDDNFYAFHTTSVNKHFNYGALYHYIYGQGYYDCQSTSFMRATFFCAYNSDRYDLRLNYTHNFMKMSENGGITDDGYITNPEDYAESYKSSDLPTNLTKTWNRQEHDVVFLNQRYHMGFHRTDSDTIRGVYTEFVPVTTVFNTLRYNKLRKNYRSYENPVEDGYYQTQYLLGDTLNTYHKFSEISGTLGIALREGFNKYAVAGLAAYVGATYYSYEQPSRQRSDSSLVSSKTSDTHIYVGGQISRTQGTWLHYNLSGRFYLAGDRASDFRVDGTGELNFPFLRDTAQVQLNAHISNLSPSHFYQSYHAQYAWWDNDFDRMQRVRIGGRISLPKTRTVLKAAVENLSNYVYLANEGVSYTDDDGNTVVTNSTVAKQASGSVQVVSATLEQNFKLGILHFDNDITWQTTSDEDVLPLPTLTTYHNLYLDFCYAHVLFIEIGADLTYFSEYYAPDYSPAVGLFTTQNASKKIKVGNYPLISVYANFYLKKTRFYVQYYHANQGDGAYFWAPHYPMNPSCIRFGLSWNFYD